MTTEQANQLQAIYDKEMSKKDPVLLINRSGGTYTDTYTASDNMRVCIFLHVLCQKTESSISLNGSVLTPNDIQAPSWRKMKYYVIDLNVGDILTFNADCTYVANVGLNVSLIMIRI